MQVDFGLLFVKFFEFPIYRVFVDVFQNLIVILLVTDHVVVEGALKNFVSGCTKIIINIFC